LRQALEVDAATSETWRAAWGATYAVATLVQLAVTPAVAQADQYDLYVGAATTAVGLGFVLVSTPEVAQDGPRFMHLAEHGGLEPCALLLEGERVVALDALNERSGVAWYVHVLNAGFSAATGLIIGLGFGHWVSAIINTLVGFAIGEATVFTSPTRLASQWQHYLEADLGGVAPPLALTVVPGGFALRF
jgi:hypothetical protein